MANEIKRMYWGSQASPVASSDIEAGDFTLSFGGDTTGTLNYNDSAATIQAALEGLASIGSGNIAVTSQSNGFTFEFQGSLANTNTGDITRNTAITPLLQRADTVSYSINDGGSEAVYAVHLISLNGATTGTFDITDGSSSATVSTLDLSGIQAAYDTLTGYAYGVADNFDGTFTATAYSTGPMTFLYGTNNSTDGSPDVNVTSSGSNGTMPDFNVWLPDDPTEGQFTISDSPGSATDISYSATSSTVASAVAAAWSKSVASHSGSGTTASPWNVVMSDYYSLFSFFASEGTTPLRKAVATEFVTVQEGSYVLTADNVACDEPTLSEPTLGVSSGGDTLTAASIATGSPSVGSPVIGQTHALTASNVATASPSVGSPTIKTVLVANSIATGSPTVSSPAIGQTHVLSAGNLASGPPSVGTPTLSHIHVLSTNNLACGNPSVGSPTIVPVVPLTANSVTTQSPSVGQPTISQKHALTASNITTGSPTVSTLSLSQIHVLTSSGVVCDSPSVGSPTIGQAHALSANSVSTGSPSLTSPAIGQIHDLTGSSVTTGSPALSSPAISSVLVADSITTGTPDVSSPTLLQKIVLAATSIETSTPSTTSPSIAQVHALSATSLATGSPTLTSPTLRRLAIAKIYTLHGPGQVTLKGSEPVTLNGAPASHRLS